MVRKGKERPGKVRKGQERSRKGPGKAKKGQDIYPPISIYLDLSRPISVTILHYRAKRNGEYSHFTCGSRCTPHHQLMNRRDTNTNQYYGSHCAQLQCPYQKKRIIPSTTVIRLVLPPQRQLTQPPRHKHKPISREPLHTASMSISEVTHNTINKGDKTGTTTTTTNETVNTHILFAGATAHRTINL